MSGSGFAPFFVSQCITSTGISHTPLVVAHHQSGRNAGKACEANQGKRERRLRGKQRKACWLVWSSQMSGKRKLIGNISEMIRQQERKNYLNLKNNVGMKKKPSINLP